MGALRPFLLLLILSLGSFLQVGAHSGHNNGASGDGQQKDAGATATTSPGADLRNKGLIAVKVYCLVILLVSTFLGGVSPYFFRWNESFLLLGTQFAGGVFLGTSLMHFLSDSNTTVQTLTTNPYPFVFMLASAGYLLTMLGDCIVHALTSRGSHGRDRSRVEGVEEGTSGGAAGGKEGEEMGLDLHPVFVRANSVGDTVMLILALCFHSVFEGIAVGVADTKANAWKNLWTISLHKIFAAIAMGIALLRMLPKRALLMTVAYALAFAVSSPVGVGIGIAIDATTQGSVADWIFVISMGIATGVFIYVAINHLIAKGYRPQEPSYFDTPFCKFLAVLAGVGIIAVVMIWDT